MNKIIICLLVISMILIGCSKDEIQQDINFSQDLISEKYLELNHIAGFKNEHNISLYHTLWILKMYKLLGISIPDYGSISRWILSIDVTEKKQREEVGLTGLPMQDSIQIYLEILDTLDISIKKSEQIILEIRKIEELIGPVNSDNVTEYSKLLNIYKLLDIETNKVKWSETYFSILKDNIRDLSTYNKSQLGVYNLMSNVFGDKKIHISSLDFRKISEAFLIKEISKAKPDNVVTIDQGLVKKALKEFINLNPSMDPQIMFYMLSLSEKEQIDSKDRKEFSKTFDALLIQKKAWGDNSKVLDLDTTYFSLEILRHYGKLNSINTTSINKYLDNYLGSIQSLETLGLGEMFSLRTLALSYDVLENRKSLKTIKNIVFQKMKNSKEENLDPVTLDCILTIAIVTNTEFNLFFPDHMKVKNKEVIDDLSVKKGKSFQEVYILYLYKLMSDELSSEDLNKLIELTSVFLNKEGGISSYSGEQPTISDTYNYVKLTSYLNLQVNEATKNYFGSLIEKGDVNSELITWGIIFNSIRLIKKET
ncbi:hypothetical protein AMQ84_26255 [Paenibacillus riograndensis]|uniref:Uncharacterized protein n=1 Tax=Paenibacillus riograndensis TaxID=483937 RepID=A0A132TLL8_9BACL|nr:hypothetical protein [Paenibacillus riograndensis]KWX72184.1 hypothetical protein AMQ84_26255 [Paenibacillus riograndensis]